MKHEEHKGRECRKSGGGVDEAAEDLKSKPEDRTNAKKIDAEAEERKHGGRTRKERKRGGHVKHAHAEHEKRPERKRGGHVKHEHMTQVGHVHGEHAKHHAGRKPRNAGGRAACEAQPFTSAHKGASPKGHSVEHVE